MSATLFKLDLREPHRIYRNAAGRRVPGETTILGVINKPALAEWANQQGLAGVDTEKTVRYAADLGTVTHARIEAFVRGMELDESNLEPSLVEPRNSRTKTVRSRHLPVCMNSR